jgi:hypothetical protein
MECSASGFAGEMFLELLTDVVALPNIGFQVNIFLSSIYRSEHRVIEISSIIVELEVILPKRDFTQIVFILSYLLFIMEQKYILYREAV